MIEVIFQFFLSASVIVMAGIFLARSSDAIAEATGMGRLLIGSILLAGATSLPELFVGISAIRSGMPDLAIGELLGSSLMNLLILGFADLLSRNPRKMLSRAGAEHALSAAMSINVTAVASVTIFLGHKIPDIGLSDVSIGPWMVGLVYILGLRLVYLDQRLITRNSPQKAEPKDKKALLVSTTIFLVCTICIFYAAPHLAESAGVISDRSGLGRTFIGSTLIAFCTSLPEVVSTIAAVRMGAVDLAVGNILGSNSFNMIILIPMDWAHDGNLMAALDPAHVVTGLSVILATSVAVMGQLYHEEKRKKLIEADALSVIGIVIGALYLLYWVEST